MHCKCDCENMNCDQDESCAVAGVCKLKDIKNCDTMPTGICQRPLLRISSSMDLSREATGRQVLGPACGKHCACVCVNVFCIWPLVCLTPGKCAKDRGGRNCHTILAVCVEGHKPSASSSKAPSALPSASKSVPAMPSASWIPPPTPSTSVYATPSASRSPPSASSSASVSP